jgi:hypothetical protein
MKTFFNILQTIVNIETKHYPDEPFTIKNFCDNQYIIYFINNIFYKAKECNKNTQFSKNAFAKFTSLNDILENSFYTYEFKENVFNTFTKAQKHYYAFSRLAYYYKIKKHNYIVTNDLMMNKLDPNDKLTFILVEDKYNYLFNINELINIIDTAIGNTQNFFSEPLTPLNPYNNREFTTATLYNIYFQMKQKQRVISLLFHCFFLENFDKNTFSNQHEPIIRENAIKKYIFNSPYTLLHTSVIYMLRSNKYTVNFLIHENFPKSLLVDIFRPFLFHYYIVNYYIKNTTKIYNSKKILYLKLKKFYEYNPLFGREFIKTKKKDDKIVRHRYINKNYISFHDINIDLSVNTNLYDNFAQEIIQTILFRSQTTVPVINNFIINDHDSINDMDYIDSDVDSDVDSNVDSDSEVESNFNVNDDDSIPNVINNNS